MDDRRQKEYLESFLAQKGSDKTRRVLPLVDQWRGLLTRIPGLQKRNPARHCRVGDLENGVLVVEADHPAWMQLLQWHEREILDLLREFFPTLGVLGLRYRLMRAGEELDRPNVILPEAQKEELSPEEKKQMENILSELEELIRKKG